MFVVKVIMEATGDVCRFVAYTIRNNAKAIGRVAFVLIVALMVVVCQEQALERGASGPTWGWLLLVPACIVVKVFDTAANLLNTGDEVPVPPRRFTSADGDEISADPADIQAMLLYLNDIENYLERKGRLPNGTHGVGRQKVLEDDEERE